MLFANFSQDFFIQTLDSLGKSLERPEGSQEEKDFFNALEKILRAQGFSPEYFGFEESREGHSFSTNLRVRIPGKKPDTLLMIYPVNPKVSGSLNLWVPGLICQWLGQNQARSISLEILFLGAERGSEPWYPMGTKNFLSNFSSPGTKAALYLDLEGPPGPLAMVTESGRHLGPIWLFQRTRNALEASGLEYSLAGTQPPLFRFDLPERLTLAQEYFNQEIPTVLLRRAPSPGNPDAAAADWPQGFYRFLEKFLAENEPGLPQTWDRHYLYFQGPGFNFLMNQQVYLFILLGIFAALLAWALATRKKWGDALGVVLRYSWQIPVMFIALFLFLYLGTWILQGIQEVRRFEDLWNYFPLGLLFFKVVLAVFLFLSAFFISRVIPFVRWAGFYTTSALVVLTLLFFAALMVELSFSFYFLWALIFALGFTLLKHRLLQLLCLSLAPFWFIKSALELFTFHQDPWLNQMLLLNPWQGNLMTTLVIFPFLLLLMAFHFFRHQRPDRTEGLVAVSTALIWGIACWVLILVLANFNPFGPRHPIPLTIQQNYDPGKAQTTTEIHAPVPWESLKLQIGQRFYQPQDHQKSFATTDSTPSGLLTASVTQTPFLNRINYRAVWKWESQPRSLRLTLTSSQPLTIYDCNFPYNLDPSGFWAEIYIGIYPASPLTLDLTLQKAQKARLDLILTYPESPFELQLQPPVYQPKYTLICQDALVLEAP